MIGGNFRLDTLQAAWLSVKLAHLRDYLERRRRIAAAYDEAIGNVASIRCFRAWDGEWNGALYTVRVAPHEREAFRAHLSDRGVETRVYYPRCLHREPVLASRYGSERFPGAEALSAEVVSLPLHAWLTDDEVAHVIAAVSSFSPRR